MSFFFMKKKRNIVCFFGRGKKIIRKPLNIFRKN